MAGVAGLGLAIALPPPRPAFAGELAKVFSRYATNQAADADHASWGALLARYTKPGQDGVARVYYKAFKESGRTELSRYLDGLQATDPVTLSRAGQIAYWTNLYNAKTIDVVLEHYPVRSIKDISLGGSLLSAFTGGPWSAQVVRVAGHDLSLDDIEHEILRPVFMDPRIHYAVNCASIGCPNLQREPFTATTLDGMLDEAARAYVNHPRGVSRDGKKLIVSSIYDWFQEDFGGSEQGVLRHLAIHADATLSKALSGVSAIGGYAYDWSLNDV